VTLVWLTSSFEYSRTGQAMFVVARRVVLPRTMSRAVSRTLSGNNAAGTVAGGVVGKSFVVEYGAS
jgi:hypothetical protein